MSDLTTTMPILVISDGDADVRSAPPGELGHFHTDETAGRHRGGSHIPRVLLATFGVAVVAGIGLMASGVFDSSASANGSPVPHAGSPSTPGGPGTPADPAPSSGVAAGPNDPATTNPTGASATPTVSHSRTPTKPRPSTAAPSATGGENATQSGSPGRPTTGPSSTPPPTTPPTTPAPTPSTPPSLSQGMTGPAVSDMQHLLKRDGYLWWGFTDGTFDSATYNAVVSFQSDHAASTSTDPRGVYGPATRAALRKEMGLAP
jgi:hypothetical protein